MVTLPLAWLLSCGRAPDPELPPNVVVVILDDVGIDKLGLYGAHPEVAPTPTLDGLASQGLLFERAYAMPTCSASRAALLTGRHARRTGLGGIVWPFTTTYELPLAEQTLPETLAAAPVPYASAMAGKWHLASNVSPSTTQHPRLSGFGWFAGSMNNLWVNSDTQQGGHDFFAWEKVQPDGQVEMERTYATTDTTDDAIAQLKRLEEPFLLVVSYNAAHNPWHVPPQELHSYGQTDGSEAQRHLAAIEALDTSLGRLVATLDDRHPDAQLWVVGDNGSPKVVTLPPLKRMRAKSTVYEAGVRVPLIVRGPGVAVGARTQALWSVVDLLPTVAELAGASGSVAAGVGPLDGLSQAAVLRDPEANVRTEIYVEGLSPTGRGPFEEDERALLDDRFKLVRHTDGSEELFAVADGALHEGEDLLGDGPLSRDAEASLARLRERLGSRVAALEADTPVP
ncbi:MAG: sulfatase-like hydrolase/transferase [Myxococcales bacterium]|nr:sulfatase-like hydrolase/transferase [Myxococcales bacterium]